MSNTIHLLYVLGVKVDEEFQKRVKEAGIVKHTTHDEIILYFRAKDGSIECKDGRVTTNGATKAQDYSMYTPSTGRRQVVYTVGTPRIVYLGRDTTVSITNFNLRGNFNLITNFNLSCCLHSLRRKVNMRGTTVLLFRRKKDQVVSQLRETEFAAAQRGKKDQPTSHCSTSFLPTQKKEKKRAASPTVLTLPAAKRRHPVDNEEEERLKALGKKVVLLQNPLDDCFLNVCDRGKEFNDGIKKISTLIEISEI